MNSNGYPFLSRRQILERIEADPSFAAECFAILQDRHERRGAGGTESMGWMASHAARATALAAKLASGEAIEKERAEAAKLAGRYSKQLARAFRDRDLAARPELGAQAAVFGVGNGGGEHPARATPPPGTPSTSNEQARAPKRRGRLKGSKNKPKGSPTPPRRRRG
jgi:hypothetical protein